jgi:hypothetical protein
VQALCVRTPLLHQNLYEKPLRLLEVVDQSTHGKPKAHPCEMRLVNLTNVTNVTPLRLDPARS